MILLSVLHKVGLLTRRPTSFRRPGGKPIRQANRIPLKMPDWFMEAYGAFRDSASLGFDACHRFWARAVFGQG